MFDSVLFLLYVIKICLLNHFFHHNYNHRAVKYFKKLDILDSINSLDV